MSASMSVPQRTRMGEIQTGTGMVLRLFASRHRCGDSSLDGQSQLATQTGEAKIWASSASGDLRSERASDTIRKRVMLRIEFLIPRVG